MKSIKNIIKEEINSFKLYYHGRELGKRPYSGTYIFITDNIGYAAGYSDSYKLFTYTVPFSEDKIFSIKKSGNLQLLRKYVNDETIKAILRDSGSGQEMDWGALNYISTDEFEMPENLLQHLGFKAIRLKERQDIDSLYVFNEADLKFMGEIDITTPENLRKIQDFYREFTKDKNFLQEKTICELQTLLESVVEGVADKSAERLFNIPDPNKEQDRIALTNINNLTPTNNSFDSNNNDSMGVFIGKTFNIGKYSITNVYLNPKSLKNFEADVKAVSNKEGDLFVAQTNASIYHSSIVNAVDENDSYDGFVGNAYDGNDNITWHRVGNSNNFGFSISYMEFNNQIENHPKRDELIQAVKSKNPGFNFIPKYWRDINNADNLSENLVNINMINENIVWHGSTKKFDKFDKSYIGSGDKNSLGGYGIYFSENPNVSKRYYLPSGQLKQYEIPNDIYFDLDANVDDYRILTALQKLNVNPDDIEEFRENYLDDYNTNGKQAYDWLTYTLGGEMQASKFLENLGYAGNVMLDKWEPNSKNYIVFNTDNIKEYNDEY